MLKVLSRRQLPEAPLPASGEPASPTPAISRAMGKSPTEQLINAKVRYRFGKVTASGLARLLEKSGAELNNIEFDGSAFTMALEHESGAATAKIDRSLVDMVARACISGPDQTFFEIVRDNPWQVRTDDGRKPLALIPINAALWKLAGLGEEVVHLVRDTEFEYGHHTDRFHFERAQLARLFGVLDDVTSRDYAEAVAAQIQPTRRAVMGWVRHEWKTFGTTLHVREEIKRLVARNANLSPTNLMVLAGFFCDAGEYGYALSLLKRAKSESKNIWQTMRIPAITRLLVEEGLLADQWALAEAAMVNRIVQCESDFPDLIRRNRDNFAIVANGPRQIGLGTGPQIDTKEVVIRLNTGRPNAQFAHDYGWKQNVWVKNQQNYDVKRMDRTPGVERLILSGSNPLYRSANCGAYLRELLETHENVSLIPEEFLRLTIARTQRNPSSGIVMLTWLNYLAGGLQDQRNVFGYSLNDQKTRQTTHYFRGQPVASHHTHNWEVERLYFDSIVKPTS